MVHNVYFLLYRIKRCVIIINNYFQNLLFVFKFYGPMLLECCFCNITGMELMANKFQVIVTSMRKKPYNFLDQRKMDFDTDFEEFKRQIGELHVSLNFPYL